MLQKPLTPAFHKSTITRERKKQDFEVQRERERERENKKLNTFFFIRRINNFSWKNKSNPTKI